MLYLNVLDENQNQSNEESYRVEFCRLNWSMAPYINKLVKKSAVQQTAQMKRHKLTP